MSRSMLLRSRSANRTARQYASRKRFLASLEQLEPRHLLAPIQQTVDVMGAGATQMLQNQTGCDGGCPPYTNGSFEAVAGGNRVEPKSAPNLRDMEYLPTYSTDALRGVIVAVNYTVPFLSSYDSVEMETTFNSTTGPTVYYDLTSFVNYDTFQLSSLLDVTGLAPGRYPYELDLTFDGSAGIETDNVNGNVLVRSASNALLSPGWFIPALDRLTIDSAGALWERGDGNLVWFDEDGGDYVGPPQDPSKSTLEATGGGTYTITDKWGNAIIFNGSGLVIEKVDRYGNSTSFSYIDADSDSATDDISEIERWDCNSLVYGYTNGLITSITDFEGRVTLLAYDGNDQLESLTFEDPDDTGPLDPLVIEYTYDTGGSFLETVTEDGGTTEFAYGVSGELISRENQDATLNYFAALLPQGLIGNISGAGTALDPATPLNVDTSAVTFEDGEGEITSYRLGTFGRITRITDPLGTITGFALDAYGRVTERTDAFGTGDEQSTTYTYDSNHNLLTMTLPDSSVHTWTYDATWNIPTSYEDGRGSLTLYEVNSGTGLVDSITQVIGELDDEYNLETDDIVTSFTYTTGWESCGDPPNGLVASSTDPLGRITLFTYNGRGLVTSITYADGTADEATIERYYNADGTLDYELDELGRRTDHDYDLLGREIKTTLPDPDGAGPLARPEIEYGYNAFGWLTKIVDPLDRETLFTLDSRGRQTKIELPDHDGDKSLTTFSTTYNNLAGIESTTDPLGRTTTFTLDKLQRVTAITLPDPDGAGGLSSPELEREYDRLNRVTKTIDALDNETLITYNSYGRQVVITLPDPDGAGPPSSPVLTWDFDEAGNLISETDANYNVTNRTYDELQRLTKVTTPDPDGAGPLAAKYVIYTYDKASNLISTTDDQGNVYGFTYDNRDRLTKVIAPDPDGKGPLTAPETEFFYNDAGELTKTIDPLDRVTENEFDGLGRLITITLPDPDGVGGASAPQIKYAYDAASRKTSMTDALGNETKYGYDLLDNLVQVTQADPDGVGGQTSPVTQWKFNAASEQIEMTDALGSVTAFTRDNLGRLTKTTLPDPDGVGGVAASEIAYTYDANHNLLTVSDPLTHVTEYVYDNLNRRISIEDALSGLTTFTFDAVGNLLTLTDPEANTTTWTYDAWNRVVTETNQLSETRLFAYDQAGNLRMRTDRLDRVYVLSYDRLNRLTREDWWQIEDFPIVAIATTTEGGVSTDEVQEVSLTNATTGYYRLLFAGYYTDPIAHDATAAAVDTALEALPSIDTVTVTGSAGGPYTITFGGALSETDVPLLTWRPADVEPLANSSFVGSLLYEYDAASQLLEAGYQDGALDNVATNFFTYDGLGRVTQETATYGGYLDTVVIANAFDGNNNRTSSILTVGTAELFTRTAAFDNLNRMTRLTFEETFNDAYWNRAEFAYNALGQFTNIERFVGNSTTPISVVETAFTYDDLHRLLSLTHTADSATVAGYEYAYDVASRIVSIDSFLDGLSEFTYDNTNQLTGADHTGSSDETYTYDANGNRTMSGYSTGDNNQLLSDGTYDYTYDAEGNRQTRTVIATGYVTEYVWDHRNRLISVNEYDDEENLLSTVVNTYDVFDRWIRRSIDVDGPGATDPVDSFFAWDGMQLAAEINGDEGEDLSHYFHWGPAVDQLMADIAVDEAEPVNFALTDHLGTPRDFVEYDSTNTETDHIGHRIYNAFGKLTSQTGDGSSIGFTGIYFELSFGFGHHRARWYDPDVGRWVSEDPIGFNADDENLTRYVHNMPVNARDPDGRRITIITIIPSEISNTDTLLMASFVEQVAQSLQSIIGESAKLELVRKTVRDVNGRPTTMEATLSFKPWPGGKPTADQLSAWNDLKPLIENFEAVRIVSTLSGVDEFKPETMTVFLNPHETPGWEEDKDKNGNPILELTMIPFAVALWHELVGHAAAGKTKYNLHKPSDGGNHYGTKATDTFVDAAIAKENEARAILGYRARYCKYFFPNKYLESQQWTITSGGKWSIGKKIPLK